MFLGGVYALVAAHLAHLALNWNDDAFVLRQRVNCNGQRSNINGNPRKNKSAHSVPAHLARNIRYVRLFSTLFLVIWEIYTCAGSSSEYCNKDVSYTCHMCGAVSGLIAGYIFLTARHRKTVVKILKHVLFICVYGFFLEYIALRGSVCQNGQKGNCTWIEYERQCQDICYLHKYTIRDSLNNTCNVGLECL